jgi:hypothetical protein
LLTALIAVMVVLIVGSGMLLLTAGSLQIAGRGRDRLAAFNLAEAACDRGERWLKEQSSAPSGTTAIDPFDGSVSLGDGTYQVIVTPDAGNAAATLKRYTIRGMGIVRGRTVQVESVLRQASFGKYAYFTDQELNALTGGTNTFTRCDRIRGPAHSNNRNDDLGNPTPFHVDYTSSTGAIFEDMVTAAGSSISYAPEAPSTEDDFLKVYSGGSSGYHLGVDPIPLPTSSDAQRSAAWGSSSGFPSTAGVYAGGNPSDGGAMSAGIYIVGNCTIVAQLDAGSNQQFVITPSATPSTPTTFTFDLSNSVTVRQVGSAAPEHLMGTGSGMIYCTGNITSLSGQIADNRYTEGSDPHIITRSAYTIATSITNGQSITITNNLSYDTQPDATQSITALPNLKAGTLGLIASNIVLSAGAPTDTTINAVMLANSSTLGGSFYYPGWNLGGPKGMLHLLGGLIQRACGPVNTCMGSAVSHGYTKDYHYDPRLADSPPPGFPITGKYDRLSWARVRN